MATYGGWGLDESFTAATNLSASQWHFVQAGSISGEVAICTGGSIPGPIGILQNDPLAGEAATVRLFGISKLSTCAAVQPGVAASAIIMGDFLVSGSSGTGYHSSGTGSVMNAIALEALASGGGIIKVLVLPPGATAIADRGVA